MPIQIELERTDDSTEVECIDNGTISSFYDFRNQSGLEVITVSAVQLKYYGKLAIYRYMPREVIENPVDYCFLPGLTSVLPRALVDDNMIALLRQGEHYRDVLFDEYGDQISLDLSLINKD